MGSKLFITASTILLISTLITFDHSLFLSSPSHVNNSLEADQLRRSEVIQIEGAVGPESFAFDPTGGGPYTGVSDGRIIKWDGNQRRWIDFAVTSPERCTLSLYLTSNLYSRYTNSCYTNQINKTVDNTINEK